MKSESGFSFAMASQPFCKTGNRDKSTAKKLKVGWIF